MTSRGDSDFLQDFDTTFRHLNDLCDKLEASLEQQAHSVMLAEIDLPLSDRDNNPQK